jgi:phosphoenolpyruvate carboxykinase (ATP)
MTGKYTGRAPKDRFIVKDSITENSVDWNAINMPFEAKHFAGLKEKVVKYLDQNEVYVKDLTACADPAHKLNIRVVTEYPWSAQFAHNMFIATTPEEQNGFNPEWTILCAPGFYADPEVDHTRQGNFAIINFGEKTIIIGGTGYTGEIKKGIFSVLNFVLPHQRKVMSMHCSANVGPDGDTAIFFGLSGTGKTTLSADPNRFLIGDDEHGWSDDGVFNFEGGCYAKCIDLSEEKEPDIYRAVRHGAILENIVFKEGTREPDYEDDSITPNTRVSYPIDHIDNAQEGSKAGHPTNIFFLTCDSFGVLPPISKLSPGQAMYHFISGYTAKVAGTEEGNDEPETTFSACFGAPFMPLHPTEYGEMLGQKMREHKVNVWLVNTGWTGGAYGVGSRIKLRYTRAMISAALSGELADVKFSEHPILKLNIPESCPNVPDELLNPITTWSDKDAYVAQARILAGAFAENFKAFSDMATPEIMAGAPIPEGVMS